MKKKAIERIGCFLGIVCRDHCRDRSERGIHGKSVSGLELGTRLYPQVPGTCPSDTDVLWNSGHPLDQKHPGIGAGMPKRLGGTVFIRAPPRAGALRVGKLQQHEARRTPGAVEHLGGPTANEITPAVGRDRGRRQLPLALVGDRIVDGDFDDDVCWHPQSFHSWLGILFGRERT